MQVTTKHPKSSKGHPVIVSDDGQIMDPILGFRALIKTVGWTRTRVAHECGVAVRTIHGWCSTTNPPISALNVLGSELERMNQ